MVEKIISERALSDADEMVNKDPKYGREQTLIEGILKKFPLNSDILEVAIKVSVIDVTNSTHLSRYKSKVSLYDVALIISCIHDFDKRVAGGDETLVNEIAEASKSKYGVNLFSFASKYCHYHNRFIYGRDDYSIYDSVVSEHLYEYSLSNNPIKKTTPVNWKNSINYTDYNSYIGQILDNAGVEDSCRRRLFDHFVWYINK